MRPWEDRDRLWAPGPCWTVLFTCCVCGSDVLQLARSNPDEQVRCYPCEARLVHKVSDRLLRLALNDAPF